MSGLGMAFHRRAFYEGGSRLCPALLESLQLPKTLNENQPVGQQLSYLFLYIFLKFMHSSHLFLCLKLKDFVVFI